MRKLLKFQAVLIVALASFSLAWPALGQTWAQILFTSTRDGSGAKIYSMDADGANVRRLGALPGQYSRPQYSRDNRKIVFTYASPSASGSQVYVMNAHGSDERALTSGDSHGGAQFTWDDKIVYSRTPRLGPPFSTMHIMNIDGSGNAVFSVEAPGLGKVGELGGFSFGPEGMIAFSRNVLVENLFLEQIFKIAMSGTGLVRLTNSPETYRFPGWCASGGKIAYVNAGLSQAFSQPRHQRDGIYVMNADGSNATRILEVDFSRTVGGPTSFGIGPGRINVQLSREPSFSRDCSRLTFSLNSDGTDQIYVVNADGSGLRQITSGPGANREPIFSR